MITRLRRLLKQKSDELSRTANGGELNGRNLQRLMAQKDQCIQWVKYIEKIWDFFFELFGQRQSGFGNSLLSSDRIAQDCYQVIYTGLGTARSIPTPPPLSYMATGFTPSTFRRGVPMSRLGELANPFPIIQLPYHRLVNPWTLGAVHHEVAHNIQSDLGLWEEVPKRIMLRLRSAGMPPMVASIWSRWHKEIWADLCGLLLGGPAIVASLIDVVAGSPAPTLAYSSTGVHPTSYLRTLISTELLRRMGFEDESKRFNNLWRQLYPDLTRNNIPPAMLDSFPAANRLVVDTICYQPYPQLGGKRLADVFSFNNNHQKLTEEAAGRLAAGNDPGIIPARFLVGASRWAMDHKLAPPEKITKNFYNALVDR
jgi:hypothetical protein